MAHIGKSNKCQASKPIIWIIGNSVLMDGIAACLVERMVVNLVRFDTPSVKLVAYLRASQPVLIIFELDTPGSVLLLDLLREQPGINLLGIDLNCSRLMVLNSFMRKTRTMADLFQVIEEISSGWEQVPRGGNILRMDNTDTQ